MKLSKFSQEAWIAREAKDDDLLIVNLKNPFFINQLENLVVCALNGVALPLISSGISMLHGHV